MYAKLAMGPTMSCRIIGCMGALVPDDGTPGQGPASVVTSAAVSTPDATYVGLTDDLDMRARAHGDPPDFRVVATFPAEAEARAWLERTSAAVNCTTGVGGAGWRYGYVYTMTPDTKE